MERGSPESKDKDASKIADTYWFVESKILLSFRKREDPRMGLDVLLL
jgi:hypothetical protein